MDQSLKIYDAKPEHCETLAEIMRSNAPLYDAIMPGAFERYAHTFLEHGLPQNYDTQMIEYRGDVVGFIGTVTLTEDTLYLMALYLKQEYQNKGIGKAVLNQLWPKYRVDGIKDVVLLAHQNATWAKQFYEKMGFSHISSDESTIRHYQDGILDSKYLRSTDLYSKKIKYRAIYFDRDGTLTTSNPVKRAWFREQILSWSGRTYELTYEKMMSLFDAAGYPKDGLKSIEQEQLFWVKYYEHLLLDYGVQEDVTDKANLLFKELWCNDDRILFDETWAVMTYFKEKGYKIGIISDTSPSLQITLEQLGLGQFIDSYTCSDLAGAMKPDPKIYNIALDTLNMTASECLYVDDYDIEADGARTLGFTAFHIKRDKDDPSVSTEWTIQSLSEIVAFVEKEEACKL